MASQASNSASPNRSRDDIEVAAYDRGSDSKAYPMLNIDNINRATRSSPTDGSLGSSSADSQTRTRPDFERLPLFAQRATRRAQQVSQPVTGPLGKAWRWIQGPENARRYRMEKGFLGTVQYYPIAVRNRILPGRRRKTLALLAYYILWMSLFIHILRSAYTSTKVGKFGTPTTLSCTSRLWGDGLTCGVNGENCRPFENNTWLFRCPAGCLDTQVLNPYAIGDQEINYRPLVVGGATNDQDGFNYRADSFICGSALHAGVITDGSGGLGLISMIGEKTYYPSTTSNGISSVGLNASFPSTFTFTQDPVLLDYQSGYDDPQWRLLGVSVTFTAILSLLTTSAPIFFASVFAAGFFQVALASDPPEAVDFNSLVSTALSRFLPAAFMMAIMYQISIKKTLTGLEAQIEKTVLWIGGFWVGALAYYTMEKIPIQRLTPHDLKQQPGAIAALVIIVIVLVAIVLLQAWSFRLEGRLPRYLTLYITLGFTLLLLLAIPGLNLRIHHYILALLLLPGTAMQTRPSLLFQGFLVGLFIDGAARWGYASILETSAALRGDAQLGSLLPVIAAPIINGSNIIFTWERPTRGYDGVSVYVNDVERFRGFQDDNVDSFSWTRHIEGLPEYFRFGFVAFSKIQGVTVADYTKAGVWHPDGNWTQMAEGPSRL